MPRPMKVENTRFRPTDHALRKSFEYSFANVRPYLSNSFKFVLDEILGDPGDLPVEERLRLFYDFVAVIGYPINDVFFKEFPLHFTVIDVDDIAHEQKLK